MAQFVDYGTYLRAGVEKNRNASLKNSQYVLWPVLVHRVIYPRPESDLLNLFQKAILGLIRAKRTSENELKTLTGLHPELIKLIIAQCQSNGWLNEQANLLTKIGLKLLDDEEVTSASLNAGYLYQDAITGLYWPRLTTKLDEIQPADQNSKHPCFIINRAKNTKIRPYKIQASKNSLMKLTDELLHQAYENYRRDVLARQQLDASYNSQDQETVRFEGLQTFDDSPESAYILVHITTDQHGDEEFVINDPFGLRENAWWLKQPLRKLLKNDKQLDKNLSKTIDEPNADQLSVEQWEKLRAKKVEFNLLTDHPWLDSQPEIRKYFARLLNMEIQVDKGLVKGFELESAVNECQLLLEVLMQWLIKKYHVDMAAMPKQKQNSRDLNVRLLKELELPSFSDSVINILANQQFRQVLRTIKIPKSSLKTLLFAAAIGSFGNENHPLKKLSADDLQLDKLLDLASLRNQTSHAQSSFNNGNQREVTPELVKSLIHYSKQFTKQFKDWF